MSAARLPITYRDTCAYLLVPLNKCRYDSFYMPWKCEVRPPPPPPPPPPPRPADPARRTSATATKSASTSSSRSASPRWRSCAPPRTAAAAGSTRALPVHRQRAGCGAIFFVFLGPAAAPRAGEPCLPGARPRAAARMPGFRTRGAPCAMCCWVGARRPPAAAAQRDKNRRE